MILLCSHQTAGPYYVTAIKLHLMLFSLGLIMINLHKQLLHWSFKRDRKRVEERIDRNRLAKVDHEMHSNVQSPSADGDINAAN